MARPLRIEFEGAVYHVMARGNEKRAVFLDNGDFIKFHHIIGQAVEQYSVRIYAYVFMENHYHLLIETPEANLSAFMHQVQTSYTMYFNWRHESVGHLFQGRYKALLVEKDGYLLELMRYIHLNPVRGGLAPRAEAWQWSSYPEYLRKPRDGDWLSREALEMYSPDNTRALRMMREDTTAGIATPPPNLFAQARAQLIIGSREFEEKITQLLKQSKSTTHKQTPSARAMLKWNDKDAATALEKISAFFNIPNDQLIGVNKRNNTARDAAITIFRRFSRWPAMEIGRTFNISGGAISKAEHRVAQLRSENEKFDREFQNLCAQFEI